MDFSKIERLRVEKKLSIVALTKKADLSESSWGYFKKGRSMNVDTLERICRVLKVSPAFMWQDSTLPVVKEPEPTYNCQQCKRKDGQIDELFQTIESLNYCLEQLKASKKKGGKDVRKAV
jgi:DNA-binding Xre family transcriptional regulator